MKKVRAETRVRRKGIRNIAFLLAAVLTSGGVAVTVGMSGGDSGSRGRSPLDRLSRAKIAYAEESLKQAEALLKGIGEYRSAGASHLLGKVLLEQGRLKEAGELFSGLLKKDNKDVAALLGLGEVHERGRLFRQAIRLYKQATQLDPTNPLTWRRLGMCQYLSGDSIGSLFSFRHSLRHLPGQEDLSQLMNEIGASQNAQRLAGPGRRTPRQDPFDPFRQRNPRNFGPSIPRPGIPDPLQGLPIPGRPRR